MGAVPSEASHTSQVLAVCEQLKQEPGPLLQVLHAVQDSLGYIPADCVPLIADQLNLSRADVHGVISFYHYFRSAPPGRHIIQICRAESCQAMGSRQLESHAMARLAIDYHQTSADGQHTLVPVYCLGNCACSPAIRIGESVYGNVDSSRFDQLLDELAVEPIEVR